MTRLLANFQKRLITIDEYHQMAELGILKPNERVELIQGEILHMSPVGSKHSAVVKRINQLFVRSFLDKALVQIQDPIQLHDLSEPEPDILLIKLRADFYTDNLPQAKDAYLLIEVADSTLNYDKNIKLPLYAEAGIPEYWIVDINNKQVLIHRQPEENHYKKTEIATLKDSIHCQRFPGIHFSVKDILG